jgi:hypothetical protein
MDAELIGIRTAMRKAVHRDSLHTADLERLIDVSGSAVCVFMEKNEERGLERKRKA